MSLKSNVGEITATVSLLPLVRTATAAGTGVDTLGCNEVTVVYEVGTITDGTFTLNITECDTEGGSYTSVAAANIVGTLAACSSSVDDRTLVYGLVGKIKRWVAASVTVTGSPGTGGTLGGSVILGAKNKI